MFTDSIDMDSAFFATLESVYDNKNTPLQQQRLDSVSAAEKDKKRGDKYGRMQTNALAAD